jgi:hypothetical protein
VPAPRQCDLQSWPQIHLGARAFNQTAQRLAGVRTTSAVGDVNVSAEGDVCAFLSDASKYLLGTGLARPMLDLERHIMHLLTAPDGHRLPVEAGGPAGEAYFRAGAGNARADADLADVINSVGGRIGRQRIAEQGFVTALLQAVVPERPALFNLYIHIRANKGRSVR